MSYKFEPTSNNLNNDKRLVKSVKAKNDHYEVKLWFVDDPDRNPGDPHNYIVSCTAEPLDPNGFEIQWSDTTDGLLYKPLQTALTESGMSKQTQLVEIALESGKELKKFILKYKEEANNCGI